MRWARSAGVRAFYGKVSAYAALAARCSTHRHKAGCERNAADIPVPFANQGETLVIKTAGLLLAAAIAAYALHAVAQIRTDVRPVVTPIGSSSSNGTSVAWFYDSTERTVFACRIGQAPGDTVDCKAKTTLQ